MPTNFIHGSLMSNEIFMPSHIHAHETGMSDGRTGDRDMYFLCAGIPQQLDQWTHCISTHDAVIDHDDTPIQHIFLDHVEFQRHPTFSQRIRRLDECSSDISILDEAIVIWNPTLMGKTDRRRHR